jgi:hypothetical protein
MESMEQDHDYTGRSFDGGRLPEEGATAATTVTTTAGSGAHCFLDRKSQQHHGWTIDHLDLEDRFRH